MSSVHKCCTLFAEPDPKFAKQDKWHCEKNNNNFSSPYFAHYSAFNLINTTNTKYIRISVTMCHATSDALRKDAGWQKD